MHITPHQPKYRDFLECFLPSLFAPDDALRLATLTHTTAEEEGNTIFLPRLQNSLQPNLEAALSRLIVGENTHNLYFGASAFDDSGNFEKINCLRTQALFLDLDYGEEGHKGPSPFKTYDDALGYLLTLPIQPTCVWHTGHGLQACFKLSEPYLFPAGGGAADSLERYERLSKKLGQMGLSDAVFTPEHLFRVPLTWNAKPETEPVKGSVLWFEPERQYSFEELETQLVSYGLPEELPVAVNREAEGEDADLYEEDDEELLTVPYEELPEAIREEIELQDAERSKRMYRIVGRLVRMGYSDAVIHDAFRRGPDFQTAKYDGRLTEQVQVCIDKIRNDTNSVYNGYEPTPMERKNVPVEVPLVECSPLSFGVRSKLDEYAASAGIQLQHKVYQAARFHEHQFNTFRSGVIESGCGCGKSTWAMAHIAEHASPADRYIYVVETVERLYEAAERIEQLTETPVGRVHGFDEDRCEPLCGEKHKWYECNPKSKTSVCHTCSAQSECAFYNRDQEREKTIVVMTHAGFIRLLESGSSQLDGASILIDEGLNQFLTHGFPLSDLKTLKRHAEHIDLQLEELFPHSTLSHEQKLQGWKLPKGTATYARRHFIFRDEEETAATLGVYDNLRKAAGLGLKSPLVFKPDQAEHQRAKDTLLDLLNVFRPSAARDATYAYHEAPIRDKPGQDQLVVKKSQFRLETDRPYRKLWILDASAQLASVQYPENMDVYACPELRTSGELVTLHVVKGNPMATKRELNIQAAGALLQEHPELRAHHQVFVATNREKQGLEEVQEQLHADVPNNPRDLTILTRGCIKGSNAAGHCTLAYLPALSMFTSVDDCALYTSLATRRILPDQPYIKTRYDKPNMPGGLFVIPAMREFYALSCLDQIYQAIWRTAIRNGQPVEVIAAVPHPEWLTLLWRTVMPNFRTGCAYKAIKPTNKETDVKQPVTFEQDAKLQGLQIVNEPIGTRFKKADVARLFGYSGTQAWSANKKRIMALLGDFIQKDPTNNRYLVRKNKETSQ